MRALMLGAFVVVDVVRALLAVVPNVRHRWLTEWRDRRPLHGETLVMWVRVRWERS